MQLAPPVTGGCCTPSSLIVVELRFSLWFLDPNINMLLRIEAKTFVDLLDISDVTLPSISTARKASPMIKNLRSVAKLKAAERLSRLVSLNLL